VQSCRRVEESVIENRKERLHIVKKFEEIQRNSRKTKSNVKVKDLTPSTSPSTSKNEFYNSTVGLKIR